MPAVTVLRGFKVSISTLDAFLLANGVDATYGTPPFYEDHPDSDPVSKLLFSKMGEAGDKNDYRLIIPQCEGHSPADTAYITYVWFMVYAQRELRDSDLPSEIPPAFNGLRDDVVSFSENPHNQIDGQMGRYVVFTQERNYMPEEMYQQNLIRDIKCDFGDKEWIDTSWAWTTRQTHRVRVHGINERPYPLPQA